MRKLTNNDKEVLSSAPDIYKAQYAEIVGKKSIQIGLTKNDVFVTADGRLVTMKQPFCMRTEDDWQPQYFKNEKKAANYIQECEFRFCKEADARTKERFCVDGPVLEVRAPFVLCPTKDSGWFIAFASVRPSRWMVIIPDGWQTGEFLLEWYLLSRPYFIGSRMDLKDGRTVVVRDIRESGGELKNPLLRLEFVDTEDKDMPAEPDNEAEDREEETEREELYTAEEWRNLGYVPRSEECGVVLPDGARIYGKGEVFSPLTRKINLSLTRMLKIRGERFTQRNKFLALSQILAEDRDEILSGCDNDPVTFICLMTDNVCTTFGRNQMDTASIAEYFANILFAPTDTYYGEPNQHKAILDGWGIPEEERCLAYRAIKKS